MERKIFSCVVIFFISCALRCYGQGEIPVDMYTGQPSIGVPITTITSNGITVPVTLTYDINSANTKGVYGYGWNLSGASSVTREVRGLPDDFGPASENRRGWLYNNSSNVGVGADIANFTPQADLSATTFDGYEFNDNTKLNSFGYLVDTEPDIFSYSCGGVSGSFVFDNNGVIRTMPYRDVKIEVTAPGAPADKTITGFIITTNDGYKYTFTQIGNATRVAVKNEFLNNVHFLTTDYELYKTSVAYKAEWQLTRIDAPNGSFVKFEYNEQKTESNTSQVNIGYYKQKPALTTDATDIVVRTIYEVRTTTPIRYLTDIIGSTGEKVHFNYEGQLSKIEVSDFRKNMTPANALVKTIIPRYHKVDYLHSNSFLAYSKFFLASVTENAACDFLPPIKFEYVGIGDADRKAISRYDAWGYEAGYSEEPHSMPKLYIYPKEPEEERYRLVPIPNTLAADQIVLDGVDRTATGMSVIGSLARIIYPQGSITSLDFGANIYFDTKAGHDVAAGGLRINKITYFDGFNPVPVTKTFEYTNVDGKSSGKLLRRPVFWMPAFKWKDPYAQNSIKPGDQKLYSSFTTAADTIERWKYLTMRTDFDITRSERTRGNIIGYARVTVKRPGAGSATFEYHVPATYGQGTSGTWSATSNLFARSSTSSASDMGIVQNGGPWRFPHAPNPNLDYERGLLWKKTEYNEAGKIVQQTFTSFQNLYKNLSASVKVWGLQYDKFALSEDNSTSRRIFFYGKYYLNTEAEKVPKKDSVITYDLTDINNQRSVVELTEYEYSTTNRSLVKQVKRTASDGTVRSIRYKYPSDYLKVTTNVQDAAYELGVMQDKFMHGAPVETISTLTKPGGAEQVVGGNLVKFVNFGGKSLPRSNWRLALQSPIPFSTFKNSVVETRSTGGHRLGIDANYIRTDSILDYTASGQLKSARDVIGRRNSGLIYTAKSTLPIVQFSNALESEIAFSDFDSTTTVQLTPAGTAYYGAGRSGAKSYYPGVKLTRTLTRAFGDNYIVSFWVKSTANFDMTVKLIGNTTITSTFTVASTGNVFKYVQKMIPAVTLTSPTFTLELHAAALPATPAGGSSPSLVPVIDDVFFFPESADVTSMVYQIPFGVTMVTTGTGEASRTVYDSFGNVNYTADRDNNIRQKNTYDFITSTMGLISEFNPEYPLVVGQNSYFHAVSSPCLTGVTYAWDTGSGFVNGSQTLDHTFTQSGNHVVKLKTTHPLYGDSVSVQTVHVDPEPLSVTFCAKGVASYNSTTPGVTSTYSCADIIATPPIDGTIFRVVSTTGCTGGCTYTWKMREAGNNSWVTVGTGIQYTFPKVVPATKSFEIVCEARITGAAVWSTPMTVTVSPD